MPVKNQGGIAFSRAYGFGQLPQLLEARAGERALLKTFEAAGVPIAVFEARHMPVPLAAMIAIFQESAQILGDRTFGLEVGSQMTHRVYGKWSEYGTHAPTLGSALRRNCETSWAHQIGSAMDLVTLEHHLLWRYSPPYALIGARHMQHADHVLPAMFGYIRAYLGRDWRPDWVEVTYPRDPDAAAFEERLQVPVRYGQRGVAIAVRREELAQKRPAVISTAARVVTLREVAADVILADAPEPTRSLSAVIALRLLEGRSDIDGAARFFDTGVRTLQRLLRQKGFTYREIVDRARFARAVNLLRETELPILEIALALGYDDHGSFTRAFNRWAGTSPSTFRHAGRH